MTHCIITHMHICKQAQVGVEAILVLRQDFSLNFELVFLARLDGQQVPKAYLFYALSQLVSRGWIPSTQGHMLEM